MPKTLFFLASYPKSGNTWVRAFLGALSGSEIISADGRFNKMTSQCADRAIFAQVFAGRPAPQTDGRLDWRLPFQRALSALFPGRHLVKTHCRPFGPDGAPLFAEDAALGALLIVRNPFDVSASLGNHFGVDRTTAIGILNNPGAVMAKNSKANFDTPLGDWSSFHREWLDQRLMPLTVIRYEDLHADPERLFARVAALAGDRQDRDAIRAAIAASSFSELKARETRFGFDEKPGRAEAFFWKGEVGGGFKDLSPAERDRIWAMHRDMASRFGYHYDGKTLTIGAFEGVAALPA